MAKTTNSPDISPEEKEERRRASTKKRIKILSTIAVLSITARLLVKDPPPPKNYQRNFDNVRYVPGMLENIPLAEQAKLDPRVLAKMMEADEIAKRGKVDPAMAGIYKAAEPPTPMTVENEVVRQQIFTYAKRHHQQNQEREKIAKADALNKPALVRFRSGGYIKAAEVLNTPSGVHIRFDRTLMANLPRNLILATDGNAPYWEKPLPKGYKRLKPAEGITIVVGEAAARRISIRKKVIDES